MNWLEFRVRPHDPKKKTDVYDIVNTSNDVHVGIIKWYGGFRKYTFQPSNNTIFDAKCMREVANFLEILMNERKTIQ
jgi:hypothetical protein